ncbi:MAG: iron-sulfur cluster repair di-iron protein [Planctomycetota bacterium]|jgi:regulator of cell morphogenesis and NO signaling|nr:iron-sulfur cluster repair di-iron protein [Planctomycetota bacterium]MDP6989417.1 iron-sulfur cluster repair di-iron protein [Planctomycetota bacterium]
MNITADTTVGALATTHPIATRVFARHGIDFCCGGGRSLADVCGERHLDVTEMMDELSREVAGRKGEEVDWSGRPLPELIDHILVTYHDPLREELPRIEQMVRKVHSVHGDKDRACFDGLLRTFLAIKGDIEQHLPKEEEVLFPMIKAGQGAMATGPMHVMEMEHETLGGMLREVRSLTGDFAVPEGACNTWRALWAALEDLETKLHEHIHLENNVLHARAREQ